MAKILEQKAQTAESEVEIISCHECGEELRVPIGISIKKGTEYEWGYVSPDGHYFCNKKDCFDYGFTQT